MTLAIDFIPLMLLSINADSTALRSIAPIPLEIQVVNWDVVDGTSSGKQDALPGEQREVVLNHDVVHGDDGEGFGIVADVDGVDLGFRPCTALVLNTKGCVVGTNGGVRAQWRLQIGGLIIAKHPSVGGGGVKVRQAVVGK